MQPKEAVTAMACDEQLETTDWSTFWAHSANQAGNWHRLSDHLASVARSAQRLARAAQWASEAHLAGLLHDIGKYGERFQSRLAGQESGIDHWSVGAWIALREHKAIAAALACEGHHIGLQRGERQSLRRLLPENLAANHPLRLTLSEPDSHVLLARAAADNLTFSAPAHLAVPSWSAAVADMLDVRMLFSCLVDADFLDTEAHFNGDAQGKRHRPPGPQLDRQAALTALDRFLDARIRDGARADPKVLAARETLWQATGHAAQAAPGLFTLTAPTGSGKTLAMLRFALEHAARHQLRRIVLAVPFLTVIEQTARIYQDVFAGFPEHFILEHHSLAGLGEEFARSDAEGAQERHRRLLAENWDAPIVLTSNVQLLESLFSNRPSSCRKLHNLMESVVLFDEAQSLPATLAVPTLAALSHLSAAYRSSIVFATATQPAFDCLDQAVRKYAVSGWQPTEVVPEHPALFASLKRVQVIWPADGARRTWADLADEIRDTEQALVVVNLKRHALALMDALRDTPDVVHLSTNLCPEHRRAVLDRVRGSLQAGQACRLISTQCVEAGVDLDFPRVYRAIAPLEAIAQAAGRCNREGRLNAQGQLGEVIVFEPQDADGHRPYPTFAYHQATEVTRTLLKLRGALDIDDPSVFRAYYQRLYDLSDPANQSAELSEFLTARDFPGVARGYRLIDQSAVQVLVPWADRLEHFVNLRADAERIGISGGWMRRAQGLAVSVYRPSNGMPDWAIPAPLFRGGVSDEWYILAGDYYHESLGLLPPEGPQVFIA
jgi:CRISPR-associated helicase Cas3/CRISPR-associated endonuclease Cas3-HD